LAWTTEAGFRWIDRTVPTEGKSGFRLLSPAETGITFTNLLSEAQGATNRVLLNGSGVAAGDFNGDGLPDLFLCRLTGTNALYENLGGWRFREVTGEAGLGRPSQFDRGAVFADVSGDGQLDLLIATTGGGVRCFLNDGRGRFRDVSNAVGTVTGFGATTLALADVNGDGFLDLYVCNYRTDDIKDSKGRFELDLKDGQVVIPPALADRLLIENGQLLQYGEPDVLYLNDGRGKFTPVPWTGGAFTESDGSPLNRAPLDWGLSATFRDFNGDGQPDLYVCNDFWTPDRAWLGDGKGGFRAIERHALRQISGSSMGVDFADLDRDGHLDFFVVEMLSRDLVRRKTQLLPHNPPPSVVGEILNRPQILRNTLFHNRGDGTFAELARFSGLEASDWSWSPVFLDVDLDGYEDVLISAGHVRDILDADAREAIRARSQAGRSGRIQKDRLFPALDQPIVAFRNLGHLRFVETTAVWGTDSPGVHHALATADFDQDGDLDFVVNNLGSAVGVYRNETSAPRVAVRLQGRPPNVQGIGAKVTLRGGAVPMQMQEVIAGGRYQAGSDPQLAFAAGAATNGMTLEVVWRSGRRSVVKEVGPNRLYEIAETPAENARPAAKDEPPARAPLFRDASRLISHTHLDESFDDFVLQPLLPRKLSQAGPGIAWFDVNEDGREDLIVGAGKGGQTAVLLRDPSRSFIRSASRLLTIPVSRDQTGVIGWTPRSGAAALLIGSANYEDGAGAGASVWLNDLGAGTGTEAVPADAVSVGPLALADMNGDGRCELFVGGQVLPGRYPQSASSSLHRFDGQHWRRDEDASRLLSDVGLVNGAVWSDLDGDGFPELVLACEWGPLRLFRNRRGQLSPWNPPLLHRAPPDSPPGTLSEATGWWTGIAAGDFDGDGRLDLIAGNWGLNSEYRASATQPVRLWFGDFSGQPGLDLIETEWDARVGAETPRRRMADLLPAVPWLPERFATHSAYASASLAQVLGSRQAGARFAEAKTLATTMFLNRGDRFEAVPLPDTAQQAPVFGVNVADANGDGREDIFLAQNFFAARPEVSRLDAGRGLWLFGDGTGKFRPVPASESGVEIYGEQRGSAVADFDEDGRVDLAVAQNGAQTKLYQNLGAKPGLRVRLVGPPGNRDGIGAALRLLRGDRAGPVREVHAGSGWWSQDGAVQVLGFAEPAEQLWVQWPGGQTNVIELLSGGTNTVVRWSQR
jgi:hypothetical protein